MTNEHTVFAKRFGHLRSLLSQPSPSSWKQLTALMARLSPSQRDELMPDTLAHLERWPEALRVMPMRRDAAQRFWEDASLQPLICRIICKDLAQLRYVSASAWPNLRQLELLITTDAKREALPDLISDASWLDQLTTLSIQSVGDEAYYAEVWARLNQRRLPALRELALRFNRLYRIDHASPNVIPCDAPWLSQLTSLQLYVTRRIFVGLFDALSRDALPSLTSLKMLFLMLRSEEIDAAAWPCWGRLHAYEAEHYNSDAFLSAMTAQGAQPRELSARLIATSPALHFNARSLQKLERLKLLLSHDADLTPLLELLIAHAPALRELHLVGGKLTLTHPTQLGALRGLRSLYLQGTNINGEGLEWLCQPERFETMRCLGIQQQHSLFPAGAQLLEALRQAQSPLRRLNLSNCQLPHAQLAALLKRPHMDALERLSINMNQEGSSVQLIDALCDPSCLPALRSLKLRRAIPFDERADSLRVCARFRTRVF